MRTAQSAERKLRFAQFLGFVGFLACLPVGRESGILGFL